MDNSLVNLCHQCDKKFGLLKTKHHCSWCGNVFCDDCTSNRIEMNTLKGLQRACDACYKNLAEAQKRNLVMEDDMESGRSGDEYFSA